MSINVPSLTNVRVSVTILISAKVCLRDSASIKLPETQSLGVLFTDNIQEGTKSTFTKRQKLSNSSSERMFH